MDLKYVGCNIWGEQRFEYALNDTCVIYCKFQKNSKEAVADFIVGRPGGSATMSREESVAYRLGIEGDISASAGKHHDFISVNFYEKNAYFGDFYTDDGELIKKMVIHNKKFYMFDGTAYYEVTSDAKKVGHKSTETFVSKDESHMYSPAPEIMSEKDKYEKIFSEIFEALRN